MINKDWNGNQQSIFSTLGSSSHSKEERQEYDYYATEPRAVELLLELETFNQNIWECACGEGHISKVLTGRGYTVKSTDLINRNFGEPGIDFLAIDNVSFKGDIITNPPYIYAKEFVEKSLSVIEEGNKIAMFLKLTFAESKGRKDLFVNFPPKTIYISSSRLNCAKNGDFKAKDSSAVSYAWFIWEKGFKGTTSVKWFN